MGEFLIPLEPTDIGLDLAADFDLTVLNSVGSELYLGVWTAWTTPIPGTYRISASGLLSLPSNGVYYLRPKVGILPWKIGSFALDAANLVGEVVAQSSQMKVGLDQKAARELANYNRLGCSGWNGAATTPIRAWFVPDDGAAYVPVDVGFEFAAELETWTTLFKVYSNGDGSDWVLEKTLDWTGVNSDRSVLTGCCVARNGASQVLSPGWLYFEILASTHNQGGRLRVRVPSTNCTGCFTFDVNGYPIEYNSAHYLDAPSGDGVTEETIQDLTEAIGTLVAGQYTPGTISNPYVVAEQPLTLFANTDHDAIVFNVGPQWSTFLSEQNAQVWFTTKIDHSVRAALIDAQTEITDPVAGVITLSLMASQLAVKAGTFYWQLQVRRPIYAGDPLVLQSTKKRVMMEGKVYIKPSFKA